MLQSLASPQLVFSITEPDPVSYVPVVSALKLGTLVNVKKDALSTTLEVTLREDFLPGQEEEQVYREAVLGYKGNGRYELLLSDFVTLMV